VTNSFIWEGVEQKNYIEANPQFKTINIYESNMQRLGNNQSKAEKQAEGESSSVKQDKKKETQRNDDDGPALPHAAKKKQKKQSIS